jgi:hypothetical protein
MKLILPAYVTSTNFVADRVQRLRERDERGVELVEWGAMLLVIGAIITFLVSNQEIKNAIKDGIIGAVGKAFKG